MVPLPLRSATSSTLQIREESLTDWLEVLIYLEVRKWLEMFWLHTFRVKRYIWLAISALAYNWKLVSVSLFKNWETTKFQSFLKLIFEVIKDCSNWRANTQPIPWRTKCSSRMALNTKLWVTARRHSNKQVKNSILSNLNTLLEIEMN